MRNIGSGFIVNKTLDILGDKILLYIYIDVEFLSKKSWRPRLAQFAEVKAR